MIAALPMYDRAETSAAHDALWQAIRSALLARGLQAPATLDREIGLMAGWTHPELILGQTCGMPFRTKLHDRVTLVATFDYALPETPPGYYRSYFVTRADEAGVTPQDFIARRFAYNQPDSHSGWAGPQTWAMDRGLRFQPALETGAHRASARAVARGEADIAAIDAITWRGMTRWEPDLTRALKVVGQTEATPGLALIAHAEADADLLFAAVAQGLAALPAAERDLLGIASVQRIPAAAYLAVPTPAGPERA